jgi:biotin transport system substrate-specific component
LQTRKRVYISLRKNWIKFRLLGAQQQNSLEIRCIASYPQIRRGGSSNILTKARNKNSIFGYPRTKALSITALFASLLAISSLISVPIPISPVPITLQVLMVYLVTGILGPIFGALACVIYLILGAIGLPVYAGASSGLAVLFGPTGGYLFGFPIASFLGGLVCKQRVSSKKMDLLRICIAFGITLSAIYLAGVLWLASYLHISLYQGFLLGAVPFLPVDALKAAFAIPIALRIRWLGIDLPVNSSPRFNT